ncbi:cytochrome P450 [Aspergillus aurantiobrunneus]
MSRILRPVVPESSWSCIVCGAIIPFSNFPVGAIARDIRQKWTDVESVPRGSHTTVLASDIESLDSSHSNYPWSNFFRAFLEDPKTRSVSISRISTRMKKLNFMPMDPDLAYLDTNPGLAAQSEAEFCPLNPNSTLDAEEQFLYEEMYIGGIPLHAQCWLLVDHVLGQQAVKQKIRSFVYTMMLHWDTERANRYRDWGGLGGFWRLIPNSESTLASPTLRDPACARASSSPRKSCRGGPTLSLLDKEKRGESGFLLSNKEISGNLFVFSTAGFKTTANAMAYLVTLLAAYPQWQEWVREELQGLDPDLAEWKYKEVYPKCRQILALLLETLRLFPPVLHTTRAVTEPQKLTNANGDHLLTPPMDVYCCQLSIHLNTSIWGPDASEFKPSP